jgi:hypothetical protein
MRDDFRCGNLGNVEIGLADTELYSRERRKIGDRPVVDALILDLLQWLANGERTYEEVMDAWRTSCPRLPVWEDANDRGLIASEHANGRRIIRVSPLGFALLDQRAADRRS